MIRTTFLLIFTVILTQIAVSQTDNDTIANTSFRQEIKSLDFNQGAISDPMQLIQGHAPGVTISKRGSDPTVFNNLLIRGVSSYYKTNPLYVIDGIWDADPSLINPSDIELFEILKDAAETSHYGSRGANGVIIIKTKTYKGDKPFSVDFDSWLSLNTQAKKLDLLTADQYRAFVSRVDQYNQFIDGGASTDWQKEFFQNSVSHNVSLAAQGKIQNTTYRFGFWQTTNNGLIPESNRSNLGLSLNLGQTLLKERVKINLHVSYSQPNDELLPQYEGRSQTNLMYNTLTRNPTDPVFNPDGTYNNIPRDLVYTNPFLIRNSYDITNEYKNLNTSGNVTVNINEGLDFKFHGGFTFSEKENKFFYDRNVIMPGGDSVEYQKTTQNQRINLEPSVHYFRKLFSNDYVRASVVYRLRNEITEMNYRNDRESRDYFDENTFQWVSVYGIDDFESYTHDYQNIIGVLEYGLQNRYFLNVKAYYEMYNLSSKRKYSPFPPDTYDPLLARYHKPIETTGFYPSLTAKWKVSNETFMKRLAFLNNLEWKVGYGISGNNIFDQIYYEQHLMKIKDIENEKMREFSTGIDFALFENRISGSVNYYNRETDNALYAVSVQVPPNSYPYTYKNGIFFQNSGFEGVLTIKALSTEIMEWTSAAIFSWNRINIANLEYPAYRGRLYVPNTSNFYTLTLQNNQPYWVFYLPEYAGISTDGHTLFYRDNGALTNNINQAEKRIFGQVLPKFELGWANNLVLFKNVDVSMSLRYVSGHSIYNATRMYLANPAVIGSTNAIEEANDLANQGLQYTTASNYFLEKANFLRLDYITVGYNLKPKFMGMEGNIKLYAGANNLFTLTKYKGLDPAFDFNAGGNDNFNVYPLARSFVVGVKAVF